MTGRSPTEHLSEEELSDLVDGRAPASVADHASGCPSCTARLDGWALTARRLSRPLPVPSGRRDEAVAAAMAAMEAVPGVPGGADRSGQAASGRAAPRRMRVLSGLAAAAVILVVAGIGLSRLGGSGGAHMKSSSSASSAPAQAGAKAARPDGSPALGSPPAGAANAVAGSAASPPMVDLGSLSGPAELVAAVTKALPEAASRYAASGGGAASAASGPTTLAAGSQAQSARSSSPTGAGAPAPSGCPPASGLFPKDSSPQLLMQALAVYRTVPAEVSVYQVGTERRIVVVARSSCAVLAQTGL